MPLNPEKRHRIVADAMNKFKYGPNSQAQVANWMQKLEQVVDRQRTYVKEICKAGGAIKPDDVKSLRETLFTMLLQEFDAWTKEELMFLGTTLIADRIMQEVEANPWGKEQPDALGGI